MLLWAPLGDIFVHIFGSLIRFSGILWRFSEILPRFSRIFTKSKLLGVRLHPLHPRLLHQWLNLLQGCNQLIFSGVGCNLLHLTTTEHVLEKIGCPVATLWLRAGLFVYLNTIKWIIPRFTPKKSQKTRLQSLFCICADVIYKNGHSVWRLYQTSVWLVYCKKAQCHTYVKILWKCIL